MTSRYWFDPKPEPSDELKALLVELARGRCSMTVVHGENHGAFYNEGKDVWPIHFEALRKHGADVIHAGRKELPSVDHANVSFHRYDAREGDVCGWMEFRIRGE